MTIARNLRTLLPLAALAVVISAANEARGGWLANWFGWYPPTTVTAGYAYVPETSYRTLYEPVAVTNYVPAASCGTCGTPVTSYMPVTTYVQRPVLQSYTSYRVVAMPAVAAPACGTCGTAYYAPAPTCPSCGCSSCGSSACGSGSCGCSTCGCASCGYAPACSSCGCASGTCGSTALIGAPAYPPAATTAPVLSYAAPASVAPFAVAPITSTPYMAPEMAAYPPPVSSPIAVGSMAPPAATISAYPPAPIYSPGPSTATYSMPVTPAPGVNCPPAQQTIPQQGTPTLAPQSSGTNPADVAPSMPGPAPSTPNSAATNPPTAQPPATPQATQPNGTKTFESPSPSTQPPSAQPPIPDNRGPVAPKSTGAPLNPNSRTAYTMPMMRPGATHFATPWPIAKTTAALMPVVPNVDDADGWQSVR